MRKLRRLAGGRLLPCVLLALFFALIVLALTVLLPRLLAPVAVAGLILSLAAALFVAGSEEPAEYKISKLVLILVLPWTGAVLCLLWKTPPHVPVSPQKAADGDGLMHRAGALGAKCGLSPCRAESAQYFPVGKDMAQRLAADLAAAKKYIYLEYYIVERGVFFSDLLRVLTERAGKGVDVRLLYDDFGSSLTLPRDFAQTLRKMGIKACVCKRLKFPTRSAGRRDHRKIAVIDGEIAYTGGVNLADEYIGERIRFGHWKDSAIRLTGAPARRFETLFARTWNAECPSDAIKISQNRQNAIGKGMPCTVFADTSEGGERIGVQLFSMLVSSAERSIFLNTPYLAPDAPLAAALKGAAGSGVDVRLMIPRVPDKKLTFLITKSYARELEKSGVKVRMYTAGFLHAKSLVADGRYALVSTYNLDFRSLHLQAECGALVEDGGTAASLERDFSAEWKEGTELPRANGFTRVCGKLLRLFAPLV